MNYRRWKNRLLELCYVATLGRTHDMWFCGSLEVIISLFLALCNLLFPLNVCRVKAMLYTRHFKGKSLSTPLFFTCKKQPF